jgi:hypothetical protein
MDVKEWNSNECSEYVSSPKHSTYHIQHKEKIAREIAAEKYKGPFTRATFIAIFPFDGCE